MQPNAEKSAAATVDEWVRDAARRMEVADLFFGHGTANARDEACWMVSHALGLAPDFSVGEMARRLESDALARLERLLAERIATRRPLAYLIGEAWFAGLHFKVDENTLVPRSPLAELIRDGLMPWLDLERPLRVLDVGTGCGCIACALAWYWPELRVDAVDNSPAALARAAANVERLGLADRVRLIESDVYDGLEASSEDRPRYDLIVSNPPYVPEASMHTLPAEYRHEPEAALAAGADGLAIVRRLIAGAADRLAPGGWLLLEVGEAQPQTERLLGEAEAIWLEFEHGGEGVVLLDRSACIDWHGRVRA
ncbi:MAG: 50S ribosomal protein L3 N(5)-glutamine methyltransferase [Wenzhouxiangellaceae bacterium]|nr:50S ribosomal protein L3 N(5)-glutamine methyltransferase [Wenzhouxiangellaceae bacterium]